MTLTLWLGSAGLALNAWAIANGHVDPSAMTRAISGLICTDDCFERQMPNADPLDAPLPIPAEQSRPAHARGRDGSVQPGGYRPIRSNERYLTPRPAVAMVVPGRPF